MGEPKTTDELIALMQRAKAGEKAAFEAVYAYFFRPVYWYLVKRVKNTKDAEDLAQQVFLRLYTSRTPFNDRSTSPLAYLFTAARHASATFWSKQHPTQPLDTAEEMPSPENMRQAFERQDTLLGALHTLPPEQREVVEQKFKTGLTTQEIAQKLGKTPEAIRQLQCRAFRHLRDHLKNS